MKLKQWWTWMLYSLAAAVASSAAIADKQTYIVHMSKSHMPISLFDSHDLWYSSLLKSLHGDESDGLLYSYDQVLHGFAAKLTRAQAETLEKMDAVLAVHAETVYELHTTRSPEFLGLEGGAGVWMDSDGAGDVVVGVLDTGVCPESPSFSDHGMKPVPAKWKGECESGTAFNANHCNKKLVGARFFCRGYEAAQGRVDEAAEYRSPRDQDGHGTHTASTAAGSTVENASLLGYAKGTASGMAPSARVAAYKVCWVGGCFSSDILAGLERAVDDGVHVLSLSLGGGVVPFYRDGIALGAFAAMEKGIFVSCSAGNAGPVPASLANVAPWITTVGASTLDRDFPAVVVLGNGARFGGVSLYGGKRLPPTLLPVVYAGSAGNGNRSSNLCLEGTLTAELVRGKIVVCDRGVSARVEKGEVVRSLGGVGMVLANTAANGEELVADSHMLPAAAVGRRFGNSIRHYVTASPRPRATIEFKGTVLGVKPSPVVAAFSSRGPNPITPEILKPDVIAPGVNILAAWTGSAGPSELKSDTRVVDFNIVSGTSMSCPHVSGLAALLKAQHPEWSPAAIRSALMTTAYTLDNTRHPIKDVATSKDSTPFAHGAGHVDPNKALAPGLVYDMGMRDYVDYLCMLGYSPQQLRIVAKANATCSKAALRNRNAGNINYPSFSVIFGKEERKGPLIVHHTRHLNKSSSSSSSIKYKRTVTNVGTNGSTYRVAVSGPPAVKIAVWPKTLTFERPNEKLSYTATFTAVFPFTADFGSITWTDGVHKVRSPVAFSWHSQ